MEKLIKTLKTLSFFGFALLLFQSCSEDAVGTGDNGLTSAELETILTTDETAGTVDNALTELFANNGATGKSAKGSNECYSAEYTDTGFVATFNNCVLNGTDNVNGTVTVTYEAGSGAAAFTATYVDFYVGTLKINGTRTFSISGDAEQNSIAFSVTSDMTVETEDGSEISETGTKTVGFTFGDTLATSTISISGNWEVQAHGNTYAVSTIDDLEGSLGCEYLVAGSMNVAKNGLVITVDFGDGECDDAATLTYPDGTEEEISL
ncbi:hypothetical protein [Flagellimonas myxillae]|uniref:hypothetical protein n=1 Tax=Flagellimonas myxillae TaxID=2942214 RepID=UPI00201F3B44|nr:hypothetical protein [Muricauda myxillae]MCL6265952.1 hypothetical protein [Muricauda myxillae]